jgi:tyrosyl-tRNA synthetase
MTFPLLTTASGQKMGKTAAGSIWLDAKQTSAYDFYQFWINVDDRDVGRFLRCYTLLPIADIKRLEALQGADIRQAKETLAFEVTALTHGAEAARQAQSAARALFGGEGVAAEMPQTSLARHRLAVGVTAVELLVETGLAASKSAARRLIEQGGVSVNGVRLSDSEALLTGVDVEDGAMILRAGKKRYHRVVVM